MRARGSAAWVAWLLLGVAACQRLGGATGALDAALGGPKTLGFIELRGPIPSPYVSGGGAVASEALPREGDLENIGVYSSRVDVDDGGASALDAGLASPQDAVRPSSEGEDWRGRDAASRAGSAWVTEPLAPVLARAIDERGHRMALVANAVIDESEPGARASIELDEDRCDTPFEALSFDAFGAGYLVRAGRVFVRPPGASRWGRTALCNSVRGDPWSFSPVDGWGVLSRRGVGVTPAMLFTREREGTRGWFASQAVFEDVSAAVMNAEGARLLLVHGGHPVMVDVAREVGGAVLPSARVGFEGVTRTQAGVVVWRNDRASLDVLVARHPRGPYRRASVERPLGAGAGEVLSVYAASLGALVIVHRSGVEWHEPGDGRARSVARWPSPLERAQGLSMGWLANGRIAVVTPVAWAREP